MEPWLFDNDVLQRLLRPEAEQDIEAFLGPIKSHKDLWLARKVFETEEDIIVAVILRALDQAVLCCEPRFSSSIIGFINFAERALQTDVVPRRGRSFCTSNPWRH